MIYKYLKILYKIIIKTIIIEINSIKEMKTLFINNFIEKTFNHLQ